MKKCERCGASNAERARFCSNCAEPFASAAAAPPNALARLDATKSPPFSAEFADSEKSRTSAPRVDSTDDFYRALSTICATLGRVFAFLFGRAFAFLGACVVGIWRSTQAGRSRLFARALDAGRDALRSLGALFVPSTNWSPSATPNFLLPSGVLFFLWARPFALAAVVYSILSNEARKIGDERQAKRRAATARNWIFVELLFAAGLAFFRAFVATSAVFARLYS